MKIGVFGGCFNPPHASHKKIAKDLVLRGYVDKVIFVPTSSTYNKPGLTPFEYRAQMLEAMIGDEEFLSVSDVGSLEECEYTYQVMDALQEMYEGDRLYFICGTDNLAELDTWKRYEYILENYGLLVIQRDDDDVWKIIKKYDNHKSGIIVSDVVAGTLSSTVIRQAIEQNDLERVRAYLDSDVFNYIKRHRLYRRKEN